MKPISNETKQRKSTSQKLAHSKRKAAKATRDAYDEERRRKNAAFVMKAGMDKLKAALATFKAAEFHKQNHEATAEDFKELKKLLNGGRRSRRR
jgi:hypothetical protein